MTTLRAEGEVTMTRTTRRAGGNVDRVACPWLIKRVIDNEAQFLYAPADTVLEAAALLKARSYDAQGAEFTHRHLPDGEICSFDG